MGLLSKLNPVRAVRNVASELNPVRTVNRVYRSLEDAGGDMERWPNDFSRSFEEFGDDQLGIGRNPAERQRGLFDPFGGKEAKGRAAEAADAERAFEEQRQRDISDGFDRVNSAFDEFGSDYYSGIAKAYLDFYRPQLQRQFGEAKRRMTLSSPTSGSSAFARGMGQIATAYSTEDAAIGERAQLAASETRDRIERERQSLLSAVRAGMGVGEAGEQATIRAQSERSRGPVYSPLADVFQTAGSMYINADRTQRAGYAAPSSSLLFGSSGSNVRNVG